MNIEKTHPSLKGKEYLVDGDKTGYLNDAIQKFTLDKEVVKDVIDNYFVRTKRTFDKENIEALTTKGFTISQANFILLYLESNINHFKKHLKDELGLD